MALRLACATGVPWLAFCVVCVIAAAAFFLTALSDVVDEATRSSHSATCDVAEVRVSDAGPKGFCVRLRVYPPPGTALEHNVSVETSDERCNSQKKIAEEMEDAVPVLSQIPCFITERKVLFGLLRPKETVAETKAERSFAALSFDLFALVLAVFLMWVFLRYFALPLVRQRLGGEQVLGGGVERARGMAKAEADARLGELEDSSVDAVEDVCSICLEDGVDGKRRVVMPTCRHTFHVACIGKWLVGGRQDCPECRQDIFDDDGGSDTVVDVGRVGDEEGESSSDVEAEGRGGAGSSQVGSSGVDMERSDVAIDITCAVSEAGSERSAVGA